MKILLVDDTIDVLEGLEALFSIEGHQVLSASNGSDALEVLNSDRPDLIITDVKMPVMDGLTFIKKYQSNALLKDIPVVIFSAKPKTECELDTIHVEKFITKPCTTDFLLNELQEFLDQ